MSRPIITQGATTTHGGVITEVLETFSIAGKKVHLDGMQHYCPKCKTTVSAIGSDSTKTVMGKKMVAEGDKTTCGATFIANQGLVFIGGGSSGGQCNTVSNLTNALASSLSLLDDAFKEKAIDKIYWSYGDESIPLEKKSRFFDDLNLHVETSGYSSGETIEIKINSEPSEIETFDSFTVFLQIDAEGKGILRNVFQGKSIIIDTEY